MDRAFVYANGICNCSVCAESSLTREEIEAEINRQNPTGSNHPWKISDSPTFADGSPMPQPCNQAPGRQHWLLHC